MTRSARPEVRNPVLALPAAASLAELDPAARAALRAVLVAIGKDAHARAEAAWQRRKAPMAAYWRAVGVYATHIARAIGKAPRSRAPVDTATPVGTIKGPMLNNARNQLPWMAYVQGPGGWVPCHAETAQAALASARDYAARLTRC